MNKDIRLLTTFPRHPKTIKFKRVIGSWEPIVTLWLWAAENRPSGDLSGMEAEDIAIAAGFDGDAQALLQAFFSIKLVDGSIDGKMLLHGWNEHNAYAAAAERRSEKARLASKTRWEKRLNIQKEPCSSNAQASESNAKSNPPSPNPSPNPSPSPNKLKDSAKSRAPKKYPLPDDFSISDRVKAWAEKNGQSRLKEHFDSFVLTAKARGYVYLDWDSAFMKAVRENWAKLPQEQKKKNDIGLADKNYHEGAFGE